MKEEKRIRTFVQLLQETALWSHLDSDGPHTVLAPDSAAVARLPRNLLESLRRERWRLQEVLAYHLLPDRIAIGDFRDMETARTMNGQSIQVGEAGGKVLLDGSRLLRTDIACRNGFLHILDAWLWPK